MFSNVVKIHKFPVSVLVIWPYFLSRWLLAPLEIVFSPLSLHCFILQAQVIETLLVWKDQVSFQSSLLYNVSTRRMIGSSKQDSFTFISLASLYLLMNKLHSWNALLNRSIKRYQEKPWTLSKICRVFVFLA